MPWIDGVYYPEDGTAHDAAGGGVRQDDSSGQGMGAAGGDTGDANAHDAMGGGGDAYEDDLGADRRGPGRPGYSPVDVPGDRRGRLIEESWRHAQMGRQIQADRLSGRTSLAAQQQLQGLADARRKAAHTRAMGGMAERAGQYGGVNQAYGSIMQSGMGRAQEVAQGRAMAMDASAQGTKLEMMAQELRNKEMLGLLDEEKKRAEYAMAVDRARNQAEQDNMMAAYNAIGGMLGATAVAVGQYESPDTQNTSSFGQGMNSGGPSGGGNSIYDGNMGNIGGNAGSGSGGNSYYDDSDYIDQYI